MKPAATADPEAEQDPGSWWSCWLHPVRMQQVGEEPDYRFTLANERTFLAWIRTSLALLAGGVAVIKLVPSFSLSGGRHILGIPLVVLSVALSLWAYRHWAEAERAMRLKQPLPPSRLPSLLGMAVGLIGIVALALLAAGSGHS